MKKIIFALTAFFVLNTAQAQTDSIFIRKIYTEVLNNSAAYQWLDHLCNNIGGRLSGSPEAEAAVKWSKSIMDTMGLDSVWLQPVMVPHWVRGGKEKAQIISANYKKPIDVEVTALGGSVGTGKEGISGEVIEIKSYDELEKLGKEQLQGKIVFYNVPFDHSHIYTFNAYGGCTPYRVNGANNAAAYGAKAILVRSLSHKIDKNPHTGSMSYGDSTVPKIPAAAISTYDAEVLSKILKEQKNVRFYLQMNCETLPDVLSYNVIGEIRGSEKPEEIILVGGHLDSWDNGDGAHDDGAGCVQSVEVLRTFKALGYQPKRTVRAVLFINEENGVRGGKEYAAEAKRKNEFHYAAIESDAGGFTPRGFTIDDEERIIKHLQKHLPLFKPYYIHHIEKGYGGVDIKPLKEQGTTTIGLHPDSQRYFDYHHAPSDTFEAVNKRELDMGAATMITLIYLIDQYGLGEKMKP